MVVILLFVPSSSSLTTSTTSTYTTAFPSAHTKYRIVNSNSCTEQQPPPRPPLPAHYHYGFHSKQFPTTTSSSYSPDANNNIKTNRNHTKEFINHITRINISNDYSQIDGNANSDGLPEAVTKEGKKHLHSHVYYNLLLPDLPLNNIKQSKYILNNTYIWTTTFQQRP